MSDDTRQDGLTDDIRKWQLEADAEAEDRLFQRVEPELVSIARSLLNRKWSDFRERVDPRELVNEAYLALRAYPINSTNRRPFFRLMARAMRNHLHDLADYQRAVKRPQERLRVSLSGSAADIREPSDVDLLDYYDALDALRKVAPRQADAMEWRIFGLTNDEIARQLKVAVATVKRDIAEAQSFMAYQLGLPSNWLPE